MVGRLSCEEEWRRAGYGEDTVRSRLRDWLNEVIKEEALPYGGCDVQIKAQVLSKQLYIDLILWKVNAVGSQSACIIELKIPCGWTPLDDELVEDALDKASKSNFSCEFFGTWTVNEFVLWQTFDTTSILERRKAYYRVTNIKKPSEIDRPEFKAAIRKFASQFLRDLSRFEKKEVLLPTIPVDEFFIILLRSIVDGFSQPIAEEIAFHASESHQFKKKLDKWFVSQGWTPPSEFEDYERIARQFLYLLLNKILFYNTLMKTHSELKPIQINEKTEGEKARRELQEYFDKAQFATGDYETIFASDFLEAIPIPDGIVERFAKQINSFLKYDFSKLQYKDIGRIFDELIPDNERHKLGQYFTRDDVVDLINVFCIRSPNAQVGDFGCGAGTFLVRAYARLKILEPSKTHQKLLKQLYGVDISKFPATFLL